MACGGAQATNGQLQAAASSAKVLIALVSGHRSCIGKTERRPARSPIGWVRWAHGETERGADPCVVDVCKHARLGRLHARRTANEVVCRSC